MIGIRVAACSQTRACASAGMCLHRKEREGGRQKSRGGVGTPGSKRGARAVAKRMRGRALTEATLACQTRPKEVFLSGSRTDRGTWTRDEHAVSARSLHAHAHCVHRMHMHMCACGYACMRVFLFKACACIHPTRARARAHTDGRD